MAILRMRISQITQFLETASNRINGHCRTHLVRTLSAQASKPCFGRACFFFFDGPSPSMSGTFGTWEMVSSICTESSLMGYKGKAWQFNTAQKALSWDAVPLFLIPEQLIDSGLGIIIETEPLSEHSVFITKEIKSCLASWTAISFWIQYQLRIIIRTL